MHYRVVTSEYPTEVESLVNQLLKEGWELNGELMVIVEQKYEKPLGSNQYMQITKPRFIQALIKNDGKTKKWFIKSNSTPIELLFCWQRQTNVL